MSITRSRSMARAPGLALLLAGALILAACSGPPPGPQQAETRSVEAFHAIDLRGTTQADISAGRTQSLTLESEATALPSIITRVEKGVLIVENVGGSWFRRTPTVKLRIDVQSLDELTISGAGDVTIRDVAGSRLSLAVAGAGNLKASGEVGALNARLDGAGSLELASLHTTDASVSVNGTGNVAVYVTGQLEATVNGVGSIRYAGNPREVVRHVNGVGSISPADGSSP